MEPQDMQNPELEEELEALPEVDSVSITEAASEVVPAAEHAAVPEVASSVAPVVEAEPTAIPDDEPKASPAKNAFKWILATVGVLVVFGVATIIADLFAITALAVAGNYDYSGDVTAFLNDVLANNSDFISISGQAVQFLFLGIIWLVARRRSIMRAKGTHTPLGASNAAKCIIVLLVLGVVLQAMLIGLYSTLYVLIPAFRDLYSTINNLIEDSLSTPVGIFSAAIGAPLVEELLVRGLVFEFLLRAFQGDFAPWRAKAYPEKGCAPKLAPSTSKKVLWAALVVQGVIFGVIHANLVQGTYATVLGVLLGWVYWRTGKLRYSMLLHFAVNGSSLFVQSLLERAGLYTEVPLAIIAVVGIVVTIVLIKVFNQVTHGGEHKPAHAA